MSSGHRGTGAGWYTRLQAALNNKTAIRFAKYLIPITILLLFLLLISLFTSCKTPATLTNDTQHHTRDSNYHATVHRIETHDTIIIGPLRTLSNSPLKGEDKRPSKSPKIHPKNQRFFGDPGKGDFGFSPFKGEPEGVFESEGQVLVRISDRKITIRDTVFILRTDTLLRTQTITKPQKYIPPFYRFCTITLATLATFVTLAFSIHLLLRYLKRPSPT